MRLLTMVTILIASTAATPVLADPEIVASADTWQQRRLMAPTGQERRFEKKGQIMIYEGLHENVIDAAMYRHFDRIQNMMFIGVKHTGPDGKTWTDDDC